ncbi:MAG: outer membrane lipoprotein-sorting protein [Bacteroidetes bacterium]|nr:MAG: outer membrane lipoprotein-sorting protein [Bacteroidota bacterium]
MKMIKTLMVGATVLLATAAQSQTVDEIISKHVEAIGGKEKLSQVKSLYTENSVDVMGNSAPQKEYLVEGKGYKSELDFNGTSIVQCVNDKGAWMVNPMAGGTDAQALPDAAYKSSKPQIFLGGALIDYAAKGYKAELMGKDGGNFKIKVSGDGNETYYFIDPTSYYLTKSIIKSEVMGQTVDVTTTYSDFKKTDFGIVLPYAKNIDMGMFQLAQKTEKVEVNKAIDLKIFEIPK